MSTAKKPLKTPESKTRVAFEVTYNPAFIVHIGVFMSKMDLGVTDVQYPQCIIMSWSTTSIVDRAYIAKIRNGLKKTIEKDGSKLISLKRLK